MLNFDFEMKKMQPINIKNLEMNSHKIDEKIKKSIILYNTAIADMRDNNLDCAIEDLKKALSYNKSFFEAIKFMGLCYVNVEEYRKAKKIFKKLARNEIFKDLANEYLESLAIKQVIFKTSGNIRKVEYIRAESIKRNIIVRPSRRIIIALSMLIIVVAGLSISYLKPLNIKETLKKVQYSNKVVDFDEEIDKDSDENDNLPEAEKNDSVYKDNKDAQKDLEDTKSQLDSSLDSSKDKDNIPNMLKEADTYFKNEDYEKCASILINMRNMNLDNKEKLEFDRLWQDVKTNKVWTIYNEGNELYKKGKYSEALPKIKTASELNQSIDVMPWATFQVGMCYKEIKEYNNARTYFQKVIDNYPKSTYVSNAKMMINQIGR